MKLLLTSEGWWENPKIGREFLDLVGKNPSEIKIFCVITPKKYIKRNKYILRQLNQFEECKIPSKNVIFFKLNRKIRKKDLENIDVIFVFGGSAFEYLYGIKKTELDKEIKKFLKKGGVCFGISAGSYVVCPTIEAATWKHQDTNKIGLKNLRALNLVPFLITAHFEPKYRKIIKEAAQKTKYPIIALTDKQAILVKNKQVRKEEYDSF